VSDSEYKKALLALAVACFTVGLMIGVSVGAALP